jgi:hypothetical protein
MNKNLLDEILELKKSNKEILDKINKENGEYFV